MGKSAFVMFFIGLTVYLFHISAWGEDLSVSEKPSPETTTTSETTDNSTTTNKDEENQEQEPIHVEFETTFVHDPIQPYNRAVFAFNDKAYYYVMKPVSKGYTKVFPEKVRVSIRN